MSLLQFSVPACCNQAMNGGLFHQVQFQQLLLKHGNPGTPQDQSCVRLSLNWVPSLMSRSCCSNPKCCNPTRPSLALHASSSVTGGQYSSGSGELLDARKERKRTRTRKIAGVDQNELLDPQLLADTDSCFCEFKGVQIHHKVYDPGSTVGGDSSQSQGQAFSEQSQKLGLPVILLHGFGASVFSWSRVMKPLAEAIRSKALAFDRPAFGLTSRVSFLGESPPARNDAKPLNPYSMAFSVLATLYFIDFLAAEKAILVGHSAGSLVAVNTYFDAPERVAALILVAPAIFAPRATNNPVGVGTSERNNKNEEEDSASSDVRKPFVKTFEILSRFIEYISDAIMRMVKGMTDMLSSLYKKMLSAILQSALAVMLVRMLIDKFGIPAVKNAWYDSKRVGEHILLGYTKPLRAKGWDRALVEFTAAMLLHNESETKPPLAKRLHEISCPVLIVTGDTDRIVPAWNAMRLAKAIPGSTLEVIKNCGHLPHEEKVEEFVSVVKKFLHKSFGGSEHSFQAVTC